MTRRIQGSKAMGIRIKRLMDERGLRAAHLAEELGLEGASGRSLVSRWLKGKGIQENRLELLAEFFDSTPAWIATGTGPQHVGEPSEGNEGTTESAEAGEGELDL